MQELITTIKNSDSLAETPFSQLFHKSRTTSPRVWNSVTVPIRLNDGNIEVGDTVKTRQGEHFHVRNSSWDTTVSLGIKPFLDTRTARQEIVRQLKEIKYLS
jgi:hypothetical protein